MKRLTVGAAAAAVVLAACVGATSASATTICVAGTARAPCTDGRPGGAFTLTALNLALSVPGVTTATCSDATISGTAPSATATALSTPVTLSFQGCRAFGLDALVDVPAACDADGASAILFSVMFATAAASPATLTIPEGCAITITEELVGCRLTLVGEQAITGLLWTNGSATVRSRVDVDGARIPAVVSEGSAICNPGIGAGTLAGIYAVTAPAVNPGMTVIN